MVLPHGAEGRSAVCDCGFPLYSLKFLTLVESNTRKAVISFVYFFEKLLSF